MPRAINLRGFRKLSAMSTLPREVKAVTAAATGLMRKADALKGASSTGAVETIIGEAWNESVADLAFERDPYVALRSVAFATIVAGTDLVLADFDFMKDQAATANLTALVQNNLLEDREVLKPVLIHNIGVAILFKGMPGDLANFFMAGINILRDKDTIFEVPLMSCCTSMVVADPADTAGVIPRTMVTEATSGGLEVEGHGIPITMEDKLSVRLEFLSNVFTNHATIDGKIAMALLIDGEVMGE